MSILSYFDRTELRRCICCLWADRTCVLGRRFRSRSAKAAKGRITDKKSFKFVSIGIENPIARSGVRSVFSKLANVGNAIKTRGIKCFFQSADRINLGMDNLDMTVQNPKWHTSGAVNPLIMVSA